MIAKSLKRALPAKLLPLSSPLGQQRGAQAPQPQRTGWGAPPDFSQICPELGRAHPTGTHGIHLLWHPGEAASGKQSQKRTSASAMPRSLPRGELLQQKHSSNSGEIPQIFGRTGWMLSHRSIFWHRVLPTADARVALIDVGGCGHQSPLPPTCRWLLLKRSLWSHWNFSPYVDHFLIKFKIR